jgi:death on curing protein
VATTIYPTLDEALILHKSLIARFGGTEGIRDLGALESALFRPQSGYYERLAQQAAALLQSLAGNHAFIDGNKRIAFGLTAIFLHMNGYHLRVRADDAEHFLIETVIKNQASIETMEQWIAARMQSRP